MGIFARPSPESACGRPFRDWGRQYQEWHPHMGGNREPTTGLDALRATERRDRIKGCAGERGRPKVAPTGCARPSPESACGRPLRDWDHNTRKSTPQGGKSGTNNRTRRPSGTRTRCARPSPESACGRPLRDWGHQDQEWHPHKGVPFLVPVTGLEPVRGCPQGILSPWCLPFHHTGVCLYNVSRAGNGVKSGPRTASRMGKRSNMKISEVDFPVLKFGGIVLYCIFVKLPSVPV